MEARAALTEKCSANFEKNRSGLRQVVRMPGDREGCFQSRACREATQHNGQFMEAGFWTYDGEYWYIWKSAVKHRAVIGSTAIPSYFAGSVLVNSTARLTQPRRSSSVL